MSSYELVLRERKGEISPFPFLGLRPYLSAMFLDYLLDNEKPQSTSLSGREFLRANSGKLLEQHIHLVL